LKRAKANSEANLGKYVPEGKQAAGGQQAIYEAGYKY